MSSIESLSPEILDDILDSMNIYTIVEDSEDNAIRAVCLFRRPDVESRIRAIAAGALHLCDALAAESSAIAEIEIAEARKAIARAYGIHILDSKSGITDSQIIEWMPRLTAGRIEPLAAALEIESTVLETVAFSEIFPE